MSADSAANLDHISLNILLIGQLYMAQNSCIRSADVLVKGSVYGRPFARVTQLPALEEQ